MRFYKKILIFISACFAQPLVLNADILYKEQVSKNIVNQLGPLVLSEPKQTSTNLSAFSYKDFTLFPLANFDADLYLISSKAYRYDEEAALAPIDLTVGWGPMSDLSVLKDIRIWQGSRYFFWLVDEYPIPRAELIKHATNIHIIPANEEVKAKLATLKKGMIIHLVGLLVEARNDDGWNWVSSLSRDDEGMGACEILYLQHITIQ